LSEEKEITPLGMLNLVVVYLVWGSTYLAIRYGVREGSGFPPFTFIALRIIPAGLILLLWGKLRGGTLRPNRKDFFTVILSGLLLWGGGNGLVVVAEQRVDSSLTALILASTPIWVAGYEALLDKKLPTWRMVISLLMGFAGIVILSYPVLRQGIKTDILSLAFVILASLSWGLGSVFQSRRPTDLNTQASSGYQQLTGGLLFLGLVFVAGEPRPTPKPEAWVALGYLIVFGSLLAFTAYVTALKVLPTKVVMTYSYVNPVIAVLLGWLFLREPITGWTLIGAAFVLLGVAGVFRERGIQRRARKLTREQVR
jgi:drug/metabolite transporter (DMT)-like permease